MCSWLWDSLPQVLAWGALGSDLQTVPDPRVLADSRTVLRRVLRSLSRFQVLPPHSPRPIVKNLADMGQGRCR